VPIKRQGYSAGGHLATTSLAVGSLVVFASSAAHLIVTITHHQSLSAVTAAAAGGGDVETALSWRRRWRHLLVSLSDDSDGLAPVIRRSVASCNST